MSGPSGGVRAPGADLDQVYPHRRLWTQGSSHIASTAVVPREAIEGPTFRWWRPTKGSASDPPMEVAKQATETSPSMYIYPE